MKSTDELKKWKKFLSLCLLAVFVVSWPVSREEAFQKISSEIKVLIRDCYLPRELESSEKFIPDVMKVLPRGSFGCPVSAGQLSEL